MVIHLETLQAVRSGNEEPGMHLPAGLYLILELAGLCSLVSVDINSRRTLLAATFSASG